MTEPDRHAVRQGRIQLLGIVAVFVVPLLVAAAWYFSGARGAPTASVNGELIDPPRPLKPFELGRKSDEAFDLADMRGHWTLLQTVGGTCDTACRERLYYTRQIHDALAQDRVRVNRVAIAFDGADTPGLAESIDDHPGLILLEGEASGPLMRQLPGPRTSAALYLIDPLGNVMLRFDADVAPDAIIDDVEHALDTSQIG